MKENVRLFRSVGSRFGARQVLLQQGFNSRNSSAIHGACVRELESEKTLPIVDWENQSNDIPACKGILELRGEQIWAG